MAGIEVTITIMSLTSVTDEAKIAAMIASVTLDGTDHAAEVREDRIDMREIAMIEEMNNIAMSESAGVVAAAIDVTTTAAINIGGSSSILALHACSLDSGAAFVLGGLYTNDVLIFISPLQFSSGCMTVIVRS